VLPLQQKEVPLPDQHETNDGMEGQGLKGMMEWKHGPTLCPMTACFHYNKKEVHRKKRQWTLKKRGYR